MQEEVGKLEASMRFKSYEAQAAYNELSLAQQRLLYKLSPARIEEMMGAAFEKPRGILDIDRTIDEFGIPRRVQTRPGHDREATMQFDAFHAFLLRALLIRDSKRKEEVA